VARASLEWRCFVWLVFWLLIYRKPRSILAYQKRNSYIRSDPQQRRGKSNGLLASVRETWAFVLASFRIRSGGSISSGFRFLQSQTACLDADRTPIVVIYLLSMSASVARLVVASMITRGSTLTPPKIAMSFVRWRHAGCVCIPGGDIGLPELLIGLQPRVIKVFEPTCLH